MQHAGIPAWIDEQLHPARIENRALEARLAGFVSFVSFVSFAFPVS